MAQIRNKKIATHKKKDLIIECVTAIGYMGPLLYFATLLSFFEEALCLKWILIVLTLVLGIGVPMFFHKTK